MVESVKAKYGNIQYVITSGTTGINSRANSTWWKDIVKLENSSTFSVMVGNLLYALGNGDIIPFWESVWLGDIILKEAFYDI